MQILKQNHFLKIWRLVPAKYRIRGIVIFVLTLVGTVLEMLGLGLILPVMSVLIDPNYFLQIDLPLFIRKFVENSSQSKLIIAGMVSLFTVYCIKGLYLAVLAWEQARYTYSIKTDISNGLLHTYLFSEFDYHLAANSSYLIRNITKETEEFVSHGLVPALRFVSELCMVVGIIALLIIVNPLITTFLIATVFIAMFIFYRITKDWLLNWGEKRQQFDGQKIQKAQEALGSMKDAKILGREQYFLNAFAIANTQSARMAQNQLALSQLPYVWLEVVTVGALAILVTISLYNGSEIASLMPLIGLFGAASFRIIPSANRLLLALQALRFAAPVIELLGKEIRTTKKNKTASSDKLRFKTRIELEDVSFRYSDANVSTITNLSLSIKHGQTVGVVGTSGAGKSTLVHLILGLLKPSSGMIRIDGKNIANHLYAWQKNIGYVPQHIFLTDNTLRRNIAFGIEDRNIVEADVHRAIEQAQLTSLIETLPLGLDTVIGEQGARLSGGQRQRIGIARALYRSPSVLVLDEASSALDTRTESALVESINRMRSQMTIIVVSHRQSTLKYCDQVFRIEKGQLIPLEQ